VLGGIAFLGIFDFVREQLQAFYFASQGGSRSVLRMFIQWTFGILRMAILVRVVCSWVRISPYSRWVRWAFVLSEPILRPLRQIVPTLGMVDVTPIIAYLILGLLGGFLVGLT
jgi:YggT family protein